MYSTHQIRIVPRGIRISCMLFEPHNFLRLDSAIEDPADRWPLTRARQVSIHEMKDLLALLTAKVILWMPGTNTHCLASGLDIFSIRTCGNE